MQIFTIGHSNHAIERLLALLTENGVTMVVDVRTAPYSRYNPQFNRDSLEAALTEHGLTYVYAGKHLGGRPADPMCYKSRALPAEGVDYLHEVDYPEVMKREWFLNGIARLLELADVETCTVLCSEEKPSQCHRHHLIAKYLLAHHPDVRVRHIRGDGTVFGAGSILKGVEEPDARQGTLF